MSDKKRGFAALDKKTVQRHASAGGKKAHAIGKAHTWDSSSARIAGAKGGRASAARKVGAHAPKSPAPVSDKVVAGPSAEEDLENLEGSSCGSSACGSHG